MFLTQINFVWTANKYFLALYLCINWNCLLLIYSICSSVIFKVLVKFVQITAMRALSFVSVIFTFLLRWYRQYIYTLWKSYSVIALFNLHHHLVTSLHTFSQKIRLLHLTFLLFLFTFNLKSSSYTQQNDISIHNQMKYNIVFSRIASASQLSTLN